MTSLKFAAIDFETANDSKSSICSIGLVIVENGIVIQSYHSLVKPYPFKIGYWQKKVHGIEINDLEDKKDFPEIWREIEPLIEDCILVAHNAGFDRSVLSSTLTHYRIDKYIPKFVCTYQAARKIWPSEIKHTLPHISNMLGIDLEHHNSLSDANAAANIAIEILNITGRNSLSEFIMNPPKLKRADPILKNFSLDISAPRTPNLKASPKIKLPTFEEDENHPFYKKTVVFTGKLEAMERSEAENLVNEIGGYFSDSLTMKTNILVNAGCEILKSHPLLESRKIQKAREYKNKGLDIMILSESDFYDLIGL